jgi:hypothetical protein
MSQSRVEKIIVKRRETLMDQWIFDVSIDDGYSGSEYEVTMQKTYFELLTKKRVAPEVLIEQSFRFLIAHEPKESILRDFDISEIEEYFPDFRETISHLAD